MTVLSSGWPLNVPAGELAQLSRDEEMHTNSADSQPLVLQRQPDQAGYWARSCRLANCSTSRSLG
jgi:hypothetical protein